MEFNPITIITSLLTIITVFYLWCKYKQTYWARRGVYSPPSNWFFGHFRNVLCLRESPPSLLGKLHNSSKDEPVVGIYILQKPFLLLRDADVIKQVLIKDFDIFTNRYFASNRKNDVVAMFGMFSLDNPQWKYVRTKLSSAFSTSKQKKLFELMIESSQNMKNYLEEKVHDKKNVTLEVRSMSTKYTTDVISSLTFGIRTNSFEEPESEFFKRSRDMSRQDFIRLLSLFLNFFFPSLADYVNETGLAGHDNYFRKIFWESMISREKSGIKRGDIIDLLIDLKNQTQSEEYDFNGNKLFAQSAMFFAAGLETSAITMCFTLLELAKNPEILKKVREELKEKLGSECLTYERISELHYLTQCISETLRLYPPAPIIDRVALQDYKIPGTKFVIEKGTPVYAVLTGLHLDPEHHPDPLKYDPDRFSEERKHEIKPFTYMPFGEGPRICIGMRTGQLQTMVGLITILRDYEISLNPDYKNEVSKHTIFIAPSDGIKLYFKKSQITSH